MIAMRKKLGLNQTDFWARVQVSQSAGSRYEAGRAAVPAPVAAMLELVYGKKPLQMLAKMRGCAVSELVA